MRKNPPGIGAFTLIEMLTAMAVFLLLSVIIFQIVSETARSSGAGNRLIEVTRSARTALDTLGEDLSSAVTGYYGQGIMADEDALGNTIFAFPCISRGERRTDGIKSRLGAIFYRVKPRTENSLGGATVPMLCRGFLLVPWENSGGNNVKDRLDKVFLAAGAAGDDPDVSTDTLGDMIFRMEAVFVKTNGDVVANPPLLVGSNMIDLNEIRAIVVGVAALDKKTQALLVSRDPGSMTLLGQRLAKVSENGKTPKEVWSKINLSDFPSAAQNVRFFQRTFYVK